jgi:hypothetical protein
MSLSFFKLHCQKCDSQFTYAPGTPRYTYKTPSGKEIPAAVTDGWCNNCKKPTKIQTALSVIGLNEKVEATRATLLKLPRPGLFGSLFQRRLTPDEHWERDIAKLEEARLLELLAALKGQDISARCLTCSSTDVSELNEVKRTSNGKEIIHPGCGGGMRHSEAGRLSQAQQPAVLIPLSNVSPPLGPTESYRDATIDLLNAAMAIDIHNEEIFKDLKVNSLEATIAIFWMVERTLHGLPKHKHEAAGTHLFESIIEWMKDDYEAEEIKSLVIPAFRKRIEEYSSLFSTSQNITSQAALLRTMKAISENVSGEQEAHIADIMSVLLKWYEPIVDAGKQFIAMDKSHSISWAQ